MKEAIFRKVMAFAIIGIFICASVVSAVSFNDFNSRRSLVSDFNPIFSDPTVGVDFGDGSFIDHDIGGVDDVEFLSVEISEFVSVLDDGSADLTVVMDIYSPLLVDLYMKSFGITNHIGVVDMEVPVDADRVMSIERDGKVRSEVVVEPVRERFFTGIAQEQKYLFGFDIVEFYGSRIYSNDGYSSLKVSVDAHAVPSWSGFVEKGERLELSMSSAPPVSMNDFLYHHMDISRTMLLSFDGEQVFEKSWEVYFDLPSDVSILSVESNEGRFDFGGGSFLETYLSDSSSNSLVFSSELFLTEKTFEVDSFDVDRFFKLDCSFSQGSVNFVRVYPLDFSTGNLDSFHFHAEPKLDIINWDKYMYNEDGDYIHYTLRVTFYLIIDGYIYVDLGAQRAYIETDVTAGLEIEAMIEGKLSWDFELPFGSYTMESYNWIGSQTLVITPHVEPVGGVSVTVEGYVYLYLNPEATYFFKAGADLDIELSWEPLKFRRIWDCYNKGSRFEKYFELDASVTVKPYLGFAFSVLVFEIIGPRVEPHLYVEGTLGYHHELDGGSSNGIYWHAVLGFEIYVGVQLTRFYHWNWPDRIVNIKIKEWDSKTDPEYCDPPDYDPPVTSILMTPMVNGWTSNSTCIWLNAIDPGARASGLGKTYFRAPGSQYGDSWVEFDDSFDYSMNIGNIPYGLYEDTYYVEFYSVDLEGNEESHKKEFFDVDHSPPVSFSTLGELSNGDYISTRTPITLDASDQGCGQWMICFRIWYDGGWSDWSNENFSDFDNHPLTLTLNRVGDYRFQWFAVDALYNGEDRTSAVIHERVFHVVDIFNYLQADADGPYYADPGESVILDGSGSSPQDIITGYRWDFEDDGGPYDGFDTVWQTDSTITHIYDGVGLYAVRLQVRDGKGHTSSDRTSVFVDVGWEIDVVTASLGWVSINSCLDLDSNGFPHIVFWLQEEDSGNAILYYSYWDGSNWNFERILDIGAQVAGSFDLSFALDSNDLPHIVYYDNLFSIEYTHWTGSSWEFITIYEEEWYQNLGSLSLAIDSEDNPHVIYTLHNGFGYEGNVNRIQYAILDNNEWIIRSVTSGLYGFLCNSLALDSDDIAHISYFREEQTGETSCLRYSKRNSGSGNPWIHEIVHEEANENHRLGLYNSIALDVNDVPHISYSEYGGTYPNYFGYLRYANRIGGSWNIYPIVDNDAGGRSWIDLDSNDDPHISYCSRDNCDLRYAAKMGASWTKETIDTNGAVGQSSTIKLDSNDKPHISYFEFNPNYKAIRYTTIGVGTNSYPIPYAANDPDGSGMVSMSLGSDPMGPADYVGVADELINFDAVAGFDFDGIIVGYRWDWTNDGVWDTDWVVDPVVNHSYSDSGSFVVKVQAVDDGGGISVALAVVEIENSPPRVPSNPGPFINVPFLDVDVDLSWSGGDPDDGDTVTYDVYLGTSSPPPLFLSISRSAVEDVVSWDPGVLLYDSDYYWQIVASDNDGLTSSGPIWHFSTREENVAPYYPVPSAPVDGGSSVAITSDLFWMQGDPNSETDLVSYDIFFGTSSNPPFVMSLGPYLGRQETLVFELDVLDYDTTYYWKVVAEDDSGLITVGSIWSFTTGVWDPWVYDHPKFDGVPDGVIVYDEVVNAIQDYFQYKLDYSQVVDVIQLYYGGTVSSQFGLDNPFAVRSMPDSVYTSSLFDVNISCGNILFGQVNETLPSGFIYDSCTLPEGNVEFFNDNVVFTLFQIYSFNYSLISPSVEGSYLFTGVLEDESHSVFDVDGDSQITVVKNVSPIAVNDDYYIDEDGTLNIGSPGVLGNDYDPDDGPDPLIAVILDAPSNAEMFDFNEDGSFDYSPADDFCGHDSYTYQAFDGLGYSNNGIVNIYVECICDPPNQPGDPIPIAGSVVDRDVVLSWTCVDPDLDAILDYDVYFGTINPPPKVVSNQVETSYDPGFLDFDETYYWMIVANDNCDYSVAGPIWNFTLRGNVPPDDPILDPNNPNSGIKPNSYTFKASTVDPDGDNVHYWFDWGDGTNSDWLGPFASGDNCSADHIWNECGAYNVKVKAKDKFDAESDWSDSQSIVITEDVPPSVEITKPNHGFYIRNKRILTLKRTIVIGDVDVEVDASDESGIDRVEFYVDDVSKHVDYSEPFNWFWDSEGYLLPHRRTLKVIAYDVYDNSEDFSIWVWKMW